jgi:hypothetical protein
MLRYAGEFSGFRLAAGIGYERIHDRATDTITGPAQAYWTGRKPDIDTWGGSVAVMHVPSGLFVQGHYMTVEYGDGAPALGSGYWGQALTPSTGAKAEAHQWMIQGGIAKNWFGIGNTALYGEYSSAKGWGASQGTGRSYDVDPTTVGCQTVSPAFAAPSATTGGGATLGTGLTGACGVTDTKLDTWGFGITQNVDAAASTLYLGYRHFSADIDCKTTGLNCTGSTSGAVVNNKLLTEDIHVIAGGAVVRF